MLARWIFCGDRTNPRCRFPKADVPVQILILGFYRGVPCFVHEAAILRKDSVDPSRTFWISCGHLGTVFPYAWLEVTLPDDPDLTEEVLEQLNNTGIAEVKNGK